MTVSGLHSMDNLQSMKNVAQLYNHKLLKIRMNFFSELQSTKLDGLPIKGGRLHTIEYKLIF